MEYSFFFFFSFFFFIFFTNSELELIMLRASRTPGPNQYQNPMNSSSLSTRGCGKISDANVPGSIDQAIAKTKENPGVLFMFLK